jgi:Spy/CpxP family protein refolding chaperone
VRFFHLAIIGLFVGVLSLASPSAPAQPGDAQPDLESLAGELGLSRAQLGQIRSLVDAGRKQEIALRAEMDVIEVDLRRELTRAAPDETRVASWADRLGSLDGAVRKSRILTWVKMRKVLTAAQRRKLASLRGDRSAAVATSPRGKLEVIAQPWAHIHVDGRLVGETPVITELTPGRHEVRAESPDHRSIRRTVMVKPGETVRLALELDPASIATCDEVSCLVAPEKACCGHLKSTDGARLSRADISKGIAAVRGKIADCGSRHDFTGKAIASVTVPPDGRAISVSIDARTGKAAFRDCLTAAIKSARFPRAKQTTTFRYPLLF